jgi:hypothetical protein
MYLIGLGSSQTSSAQVNTSNKPQADTLALKKRMARTDSLYNLTQKTGRKVDAESNSAEKESEPPNTSVRFSAKDSLFIQLKGGRKAFLYGASQVNHESGSLKSGEIAVDFETSIMSAQSSSDEDTLSHPVLTRGTDELRSRKVLFNYKTEQGKFHVARMNYNEGNLIGTEVKNKTKHVVFVGDGIYSTCELDHPHYFIKAKKILTELGYAPSLFFGDGYKGIPAYAPYDGIIVTCGAPFLPEKLVEQLKVGGKLVIPIGETDQQTMYRFVKKADGTLVEENFGPCAFVPMLEKGVK